MNKGRRSLLRDALAKIGEARDLIDQAKEEEQAYYDEMPEGFQQGEKGEKAQAAADKLDEACTHVDDATSAVEEAIEG